MVLFKILFLLASIPFGISMKKRGFDVDFNRIPSVTSLITGAITALEKIRDASF
jgi:hypothetical protein